MIPAECIMHEISEYWEHYRHCTRPELHASADLMKFLEHQVKEHPWFQSAYNALSFASKGIYEPVKCMACGKELRIDNAREGKKYCSGKCAMNAVETKEKTKITMRERYGCDAPMQIQSAKDLQRKTMMKRYGAACTLSSDVLKEKVKKTVLEKYGVDHICKLENVRKKIKETCRERYGVDHYAQTDEFREQSSRLNRHKGYEIIKTWKDYVVPLFSEDEYEGMQGVHHGKVYRWKCVKCGNEFDFSAHSTGVHGELGTCFPVCPHCHKKGTVSFEEVQMLDFIKSIYGGKIIENAHDVIPPYELDIYVPEKKVAIEFDGLYWHCEDKRGMHYHDDKTRKCIENGIQLVHVFEDEWIKNMEIVKDRISSILGICGRRVFARNCDVRIIGHKTSNDFLCKNHLQGGDTAPIRYGLFFGDELVSVMTFGKPRFSDKYDFELVRFASKIGMHVVGGASKMFSAFRKEHAGSVVSYADRRYSNGHLYEAIGFVFDHVSKPNYWWFKNKNKLGRYECQKHLLGKVLGEKFDSTLSESENMKRNGYRKIYDCGNIVYVYQEGDK